jgi:hypothetical protein
VITEVAVDPLFPSITRKEVGGKVARLGKVGGGDTGLKTLSEKWGAVAVVVV